MKKITIADVADHLGVSKTTVSRAISGKGRISEETRMRVLEYIEAADYKPNVIAKGLAQSKTYNVAVILPTDCNLAELPFFQNCMCGICEAASQRDYDVLTVYTKTGETGDLERIISNHKIDGVILSRTLVKDAAADYIKEKKVPLVAVGSSPDESLVQVDHDHRSACCELTRRLMAKGIRRLGLIGGNESHVVTRNRYEGYTDAFRMAGRPVERELVYLGMEKAEEIEAAVELLLARNADCIVCMDDMICNHVLKKLDQDNISVPGHVEVASFYGGILTENAMYPVTTLEFDAKKLGYVTCRTLLDVIEGRETAAKQLLPYTVRTA
ncbi:MAG: LacI family DNA-binding transcriptional regulator [Lachnospiraceae bacterium]|nr:LacI family DNA-binding transcriptional regulator [Lachnospiraceae bacterium]